MSSLPDRVLYKPFLLVILLWLLVVSGGLWLWGSMQGLKQQQRQSQQGLQALVQQAAQASASRQAYADYHARHTAWHRTGFTLAANPATLVAHVRRLQQSVHLPHFSYVLQAPQPCRPLMWPGAAVTAACPGQEAVTQQLSMSASSLQVTGMQFTLPLQHEAELLAWLQALSHDYGGMLLARECEWLLSDGEQHLQGSCLLHWFNFPARLPGRPASGA